MKFNVGDQVMEPKGSFIYKIVKLPFPSSNIIIHGEVLSTTNPYWSSWIGQTFPLDPSTLVLYNPRKKSHPLTNIFK